MGHAANDVRPMIERLKGRDGSLWLRNPDTSRVWPIKAAGGADVPQPKEPRGSWAKDPERLLKSRVAAPAVARATFADHIAANLEKRAKRAKPRARDDKTGELF